jgi:hypothetical protein
MAALRKEMGSDPISATTNYLGIRHSHFRITLRDWLRGLDKALIAIASALTFILTAMVVVAIFGMARALLLLLDPATSAAHRVEVIGAWQILSFVLLRALREAALMPRAQGFFDALPIAPRLRLRADVVLALLTYSFLWLPVGWVIADPLSSRTAALGITVVALAELIVISLGVNLTLLRDRPRQAVVCLAALISYASLRGAHAGFEATRAAAALLAAGALWWSYQPGTVRAPVRRQRSEFADQIAIRTGLVVPLLAHELRANLAVRVGAIAATLAGCLVVIQLRTNDTSSASVLLFVAAVATLALYSLPALLRRTLLTKLEFLAGQPAFGQRMRLAVYLLPTLLFCAALSVGWIFDRSGRAGVDAGIFCVLYVAGVAGARLGLRITSWFIPFAVTIAVIILGAMT